MAIKEAKHHPWVGLICDFAKISLKNIKMSNFFFFLFCRHKFITSVTNLFNINYEFHVHTNTTRIRTSMYLNTCISTYMHAYIFLLIEHCTYACMLTNVCK